jgi:hypothetical protein
MILSKNGFPNCDFKNLESDLCQEAGRNVYLSMFGQVALDIFQ